MHIFNSQKVDRSNIRGSDHTQNVIVHLTSSTAEPHEKNSRARSFLNNRVNTSYANSSVLLLE